MHHLLFFKQIAGTDKNSSVPASINLLSKITISLSHPEQVLTSHIHLQTLISASKADFPAYALPHNLTHLSSHQETVYLSGQDLPEELFLYFCLLLLFPPEDTLYHHQTFFYPDCSSLLKFNTRK